MYVMIIINFIHQDKQKYNGKDICLHYHDNHYDLITKISSFLTSSHLSFDYEKFQLSTGKGFTYKQKEGPIINRCPIV
jgi:hypothetical protein